MFKCFAISFWGVDSLEERRQTTLRRGGFHRPSNEFRRRPGVVKAFEHSAREPMGLVLARIPRTVDAGDSTNSHSVIAGHRQKRVCDFLAWNGIFKNISGSFAFIYFGIHRVSICYKYDSIRLTGLL